MGSMPHVVSVDPGLCFSKDPRPAIDAPPDTQTDPAPEAEWDVGAARTGICGVVTPNIVPLADGTLRMYYTQILPRALFLAGANDYSNARTRILSAVSVDGATWTPEPGIRLTPQAGGAGDFRVVSPEVVPRPDGGWRMYFECCPGPQSLASTVRSAISVDGLDWVLEPGERLAGPAGFNSPRLVYLADGRCRLYCGAQGQGIASAISEDGGKTFALEEGLRIRPGKGYDAMTAFAPEVLPIRGGAYRMYYAGYSASNRAYVLSASSADGLHWRKDDKPVIAPGGCWDGAKCSEMCVVELPGKAQGYRMFYEACDGTAINERGVWRILSATAVDTEV
jgi:predicted GH43/DUF377 family glycosyl hydrolase